MGVGRGVYSSTNVATQHARPVDGARVGTAREPGHDRWPRWGDKKRWVRHGTSRACQRLLILYPLIALTRIVGFLKNYASTCSLRSPFCLPEFGFSTPVVFQDYPSIIITICCCASIFIDIHPKPKKPSEPNDLIFGPWSCSKFEIESSSRPQAKFKTGHGRIPFHKSASILMQVWPTKLHCGSSSSESSVIVRLVGLAFKFVYTYGGIMGDWKARVAVVDSVRCFKGRKQRR